MKKNKLILAMYIGVITLGVASVSMSVAWYATSRTLYVSGINITIDADRELEISTSKDDGYVDHITHSELDPTGVFMPVTSAHSSLWTEQKASSPVFYDESNCSEMEHFESFREASGGYFSQKLYLKSDDNVWVTVDPTKSFINPSDQNEEYAKEWVEHYAKSHDEHDKYYKELTEEQIKDKLDLLVNAMRFSILVPDEECYSYSIIDPHYEEETVLGGLLDNAYDEYYDFYLKDNTTDDYYERVYGEYVGTPEYKDVPESGNSPLRFPDQIPNAFNAHHKQGVKKFDKEKSEELNDFAFAVEKSYDLKDFSNQIAPFHIPVYKDVPREIVVSIYIEGWDMDSVNYTKKAGFDADLTFKIEREMV